MLIGLSPYIVPADEKEPPIVCPLDEQLLEDYFKLCVANGAKPVAVVLPIRQSLRRIYNANVVKTFRDTINKLVKKYGTAFVDLLDDPCMDSRFLDRARFNPNGGLAALPCENYLVGKCFEHARRVFQYTEDILSE